MELAIQNICGAFIMIEMAYNDDSGRLSGNISPPSKSLQWRKNERMGGMVPVWDTVQTPGQRIADNLSQAFSGQEPESFHSTLAYVTAQPDRISPAPEEFGFGDLIDMVNPLQHIPLIGGLYREITGDDIKPISKIIGGGVFGGAAGVAGALVGTVIEYETGKDITGNIIAMASGHEKMQYRSHDTKSDTPEEALAKAIQNPDDNPYNLPGTAISFADLGHQSAGAIWKRVPVAEGRTAGTMLQKDHHTIRRHTVPRTGSTTIE